MADYIDRQAAIAALREFAESCKGSTEAAIAAVMAISVISRLPGPWVLNRICGNYDRPATMASLFDGIGGFPLIWERINGEGSCLWASEIEEFPMAVTRKRFGGMPRTGMDTGKAAQKGRRGVLRK